MDAAPERIDIIKESVNKEYYCGPSDNVAHDSSG